MPLFKFHFVTTQENTVRQRLVCERVDESVVKILNL